MTLENEAEAIEVKNNGGSYDIPGAAEIESAAEVAAAMESSECLGSLAGWGEWERVYRCADEDGGERWYFARGTMHNA